MFHGSGASNVLPSASSNVTTYTNTPMHTQFQKRLAGHAPANQVQSLKHETSMAMTVHNHNGIPKHATSMPTLIKMNTTPKHTTSMPTLIHNDITPNHTTSIPTSVHTTSIHTHTSIGAPIRKTSIRLPRNTPVPPPVFSSRQTAIRTPIRTYSSASHNVILNDRDTIPNRTTLSNNGSGVIILYEELNERYSVIKHLTNIRQGAKVLLCRENKTGIVRAVKILSKDHDLARVYSNVKYPLPSSQKQNRPKIPPALLEADIIHTLEHPNIVRLIEVLIGAHDTHMILEYYSGGELYDTIIRKNRFTEDESKCIMSQLFYVAAYMHSNNIIHRDIKPENIMFESSARQNHIRLVDFGLSHKADNSGVPKDKTANLVVTAYYVAPEVLSGNYNSKCDVWSCGVILYILLCGYPPFKGSNDPEIICNAKKLSYSFEGNEWITVSGYAKDLIKRILVTDVNKRLSADQALQHPWFSV